jgi:hypothetical protein
MIPGEVSFIRGINGKSFALLKNIAHISYQALKKKKFK